MLQTEKLFDIACCLTDVVACMSLSADAFAVSSRNYLPRLLTLIRILPEGQSRYLPVLLAKLSEVVPNIPPPLSSYLPKVVSAAALGPQATSASGNDTSNYLASPAAASPLYPPSDLFHRLATQEYAQVSSSTTLRSVLPLGTTQVNDQSLHHSSHNKEYSHTSGYSAEDEPTSNSPSDIQVSLPLPQPQLVRYSSHLLQTLHSHMWNK
jgi:hypothetical protein